MAISHTIAFALKRDSASAPLQLRQPEGELAVDGLLDELLRELKHAYLGKAGKQFGRFDRDLSVSVLSQWLNQFREEKLSFDTFASKSAEHLQQLLRDTEVIVDGYLIMAIESLADGDFAYLYFLLPSEAATLDGDLKLQRTRFLDVRGVIAAAKIDLQSWSAGEDESYLSILKPRGEKEFSDCFKTWVGFSDARDTGEETKIFLDLVSEYSQKLEPEQAQICRNQVVEYCLDQDKRGEAVVIRDLSQHLSTELAQNEDDGFVHFVASRQKEPPEAIHPERRQLKQFVRISGRNDHLSMSFAAECLGETITYHKESDSLTIRNLPAPLKLRLVQYLQKLDSREDD